MGATIPSERVDFVPWHPMRGVADVASRDGTASGRRACARTRRAARLMLAQYEQHFAAAGNATLAFDYRNTGASDGQPRQHILTREQCLDVAAALEYLKSRSEVDGGRIGLWGTRLGGMNAVRVAAARDDVTVAVVQCPIVHGPAAGRRYVPIVGSPGSLAMVTTAGAESGWKSTIPPDGHFDNRIAAADAVAMVTTSATRHARHVAAPLLVCVCDRENLMDPAYAALVARSAPRGVARHYDSDHFAIYHPPLVDSGLADQTAFLQEHLGVHA